MSDESEKDVMADLPLIAYPPIKCIIKLENPDENHQQEVNSADEENWTLQVQYFSLIL